MNGPTEHRRIPGTRRQAAVKALELTILWGLAIIAASGQVQTSASLAVSRAQASFLGRHSGKGVSQLLVGSAGYGVVFDGANIWMTNMAAHSVTKLRARDGKRLGTYVVAGSPWGIAFDGVNIWGLR
jgi:hypothetical protein